MPSRLCLLVLVAGSFASNANAQRPVTLSEAIQSALARQPRLGIARADSIAAAARIISARAFPDPVASLGYSKSPPNFQVEAEQQIEYPFLRTARVRAALAVARAAGTNLRAERSSLRYEVETAYATALAASAIRELATRNAADAREMLRITRERERAGDASELDVRLAAVTAGQSENQAASDSLQALVATLQLQALMGLDAQTIQIVPSDSLVFNGAGFDSTGAESMRVTVARQQLSSEQANLQLARLSRLPAPSLRAGFEFRDPEMGNQLLPTFGIAMPLPLWNRNRGVIAEAGAAVARATAVLQVAQLETQTAIAIARQQHEIAQQKVARGRTIVIEAQRVAALSLTAYREGAYPLASVLEAQRNARESLRQYIEDVQASRVAAAALARARSVGGPAQ